MLSEVLVTLSLLPLSLAHFQLKYPTARGFSDDVEGTFPCGGFDTIQQQRTDFPISGGPIQLNMEHALTKVAVYIAIGDNPGSGFSIVARQQFAVQALGNFCIPSVAVPSGLNVSAGTKASIQVVTNNEDGGGLYQCADVTFVSTTLSSTDFSNNCKNATGVKVTQENISGNPNSTTTASTSASSSAKPTATKTGAAAQVKAASWALGAVGLAGLAML